MREFPIPVVNAGRGTRPAVDAQLDYLPMPGAEPLRTPIPPEDAAPAELAAAAGVVEQLIESMQRHRAGQGEAPRFSLLAMEPRVLRVLNESLGQGEVSAIVDGNGAGTWLAQETAFAGVWRLRREGAGGRLLDDVLEAGEIPVAVQEAAARVNGGQLDPARLPAGVMNAPAIVEELRHRTQQRRPGAEAHVINLSHLPLNPADHEGLADLLGQGPVTMLSRGFGNCRVQSTAVRGIWRVRYYNSMDTQILDTIEVVDLPESVRAGPEDRDDSLGRLRELLAWLREG